MGQHEVIRYLKGKDWTSSREIVEGLKLTVNSVGKSLFSLYIHKEVMRKKDLYACNGYLYKLVGEEDENRGV